MALVPPAFINSVVAIGTRQDDGAIAWLASGFIYGHHLFAVNEKEGRYRTYLISNRHVFENATNLVLRFNPTDDGPAREFAMTFSGAGAVQRVFHPDATIDLAAVPINVNVLEKSGIRFDYFLGDLHLATREVASSAGLYEGDFCFLLGFPFGLIGGERNYVITRHGTIARLSDFLDGRSKEIIVDCMNFPGNSGGPVVTKPELVAIQGTKSQQQSYLLGIVSEYIAYRDVAVSRQTQRVRVVFEENSGLARVVPAHFLREWMDGLPQNKITDADWLDAGLPVPGGVDG
ncbi:MAG: serine protease [Thermotogota bacterium]